MECPFKCIRERTHNVLHVYWTGIGVEYMCNSKYTCIQRGIRVQYTSNTRTKYAVCSLPYSSLV